MKKILFIICCLCLAACDDSFLDVKPNKAFVVPTTLADLDALLDNTGVMNVAPAIGILGTDDFFTTDDGWEGWINPIERYGYTWEADIYRGQLVCQDWTVPYRQVLYSNVVLEGVGGINIDSENADQWNSTKGRALFYRAFAFFQVALHFAAPYSSESLNELGIPLRLTADINAPIFRSTIAETYAQIVSDLLEAEDLLPETVASRTQPSKATAKAFLARVYLSMDNFAEAEKKADEALELDDTLLDYNLLNSLSARPITRLSSEVLFHSTAVTYQFTTSPLTYVDTLLYKRYSDDDLRKYIFFQNQDIDRYSFKGNYTGLSSLFAGVSINEVYLMRAECRVRNGNATGALEDLNKLLSMRYKTGTFSPFTETNPDVLLPLILEERHKELVFTPASWLDLRRLNKDVDHKRTLYRALKGTVYSLPPGDIRYVYPIPPQEITYNQIEQNPR